MTGAPRRALLLFLDGVGIGADDPGVNPLARAEMPALRDLLGGALPVGEDLAASPGGPFGRAWMTAADATLGVPGRPQSGTGQTALLTGENAPAAMGRHFGPWVPTTLREALGRRNLLSRARDAGRGAAFANAYPSGHMVTGHGRRRPAAPPLAALAAGALWRDGETLREGRAVASSITNDAWRKHLDPRIPQVTAREAGEILARICAEEEVTLFAHYDTDLAGHRGDMQLAVSALERVDEFLAGILGAIPADALLVIASDHGNIEDVRCGHTRNPVPVIATGPGSDRVAGLSAITGVTPLILDLLGID